MKPIETMQFEGTLMILDGTPDLQGEKFPPECQVDIPEDRDIPVQLAFDNSLDGHKGTAVVTRHGNELKYKITLFKNLLPEVVTNILVPCLGGAVKKREGDIVTHILVRSIGLEYANSDPRIKSLQAQQRAINKKKANNVNETP